ncbi:hypothetical protein QE152_g33855 [Popillia japonica]|uniref:Uncharacterized protein n=1 Tax=Popillia japonica TaxID=7064 RepID=A0AAW1IVK0_POPJA
MYEAFITRGLEMFRLRETQNGCEACSAKNSDSLATRRRPFVRQKCIRRKRNFSRKNKLSSDLEKCALVTIDLLQKEMQRKSSKKNVPAKTNMLATPTKKMNKITAWFKKWKYRKTLRNSIK